ncbi:helix-turn-helix domain-containing protein [Mycobacterium heckeshornense]|uniref:Uncharacterized protein n=1 Tax=Mycobacterium heckeshornense TaxID=110505 RepID=A0A2G8BGV5_9MYCO|nr:helix-turn-helix domain-containing protein [Mycobacterium heckeshornense]KMV21249.1 hypothetical protein ACT16_17745 [Mycobacterium heckeshornense]MCV7033872.1 helix-turn-helix domain-containing protein [Mycobacterium heckeshornense]PIJ36964.1 helix-turn-helix domain-containing protein [Mycobacterium heckeshornense]BCO35256.1 hypothetical protein MHEC_16890 [Mycobacterium heckeshornense]
MPNKRQSPPRLLGIPEAAAYCGVHPRTLRRWIAAGHIQAHRVGPKLLKIHAADLDAFVGREPVGAAQ